jgi:hypothetical protein
MMRMALPTRALSSAHRGPLPLSMGSAVAVVVRSGANQAPPRTPQNRTGTFGPPRRGGSLLRGARPATAEGC